MSKPISITESEYQPIKGLPSKFAHPVLGDVNLHQLSQSAIEVLEKEGLLIPKKKVNK